MYNHKFFRKEHYNFRLFVSLCTAHFIFGEEVELEGERHKAKLNIN